MLAVERRGVDLNADESSPEVLDDDFLDVAVLLVHIPQQQQVDEPLLPAFTKTNQQTCTTTQRTHA